LSSGAAHSTDRREKRDVPGGRRIAETDPSLQSSTGQFTTETFVSPIFSEVLFRKSDRTGSRSRRVKLCLRQRGCQHQAGKPYPEPISAANSDPATPATRTPLSESANQMDDVAPVLLRHLVGLYLLDQDPQPALDRGTVTPNRERAHQ